MTRRIFCKALLVVVVIFGLFVSSGVLSAQGNSDWAFDRVREVQGKHTDLLMAMDGVEGTAIGLNQNDRLAIKVFTARPGVRGIPQELDGVTVEVVVTGKFYALAKGGQPGKPEKKPPSNDTVDPTARFDRPVPIGVSTGHPDITAGTLGCRVSDGNNVYALSNNHVYANCNNAEIDDNVLQPGDFDGGVYPEDSIGTLFDYVEIDFTEGVNNTIDAAIALTTTVDVNNATPSDGYGTPSSTIFEGALLGLEVQKYGRTTGLTKGTVSGINATVNVSYGDVDGNGVDDVARFVNQIIILPSRGWFSKAGDSGSLIVTNDADCNPVGLLFAGGGRRTIANPIDAVLETFEVTIDGE